MLGVFGGRVEAGGQGDFTAVFQIIVNDLAMVVCRKVVKDREGKEFPLLLFAVSHPYPN